MLTDALVSGIEAGKQYLVCEFYSGQYTIASYGDEISMGRIAPHSCAVFKVQEYDPTKPFIVGSTAHYSMGAEVERLAWEDGELILEAEPVPDGEDTYRVLLPEEQGVVEVMSRR